MPRVVYITAVLLLCIGLSSGTLGSSKAMAASGEEIYQKRCLSCHGRDGKGNAKMAEMLKTAIDDITSPTVLSKPEAELLNIIAQGKGKMPPFGRAISQQDQRAVLSYLKQLATEAR